MTRDEYLKTLKPGDEVLYANSPESQPDVMRIVRVQGLIDGVEAVFAKDDGRTSIFFVPASKIVYPGVYPSRKATPGTVTRWAVPGVVYQHVSARVVNSDGLSSRTLLAVGDRDGMLIPLFATYRVKDDGTLQISRWTFSHEWREIGLA